MHEKAAALQVIVVAAVVVVVIIVVVVVRCRKHVPSKFCFPSSSKKGAT